jgi:hypothetical protein
MKKIKIPNKALTMPYNQFNGNTLTMFDLNKTVIIEITLEENYSDSMVTIDGKAIEIIKALGDNVEVDFKEKHLFIRKDKNTCKAVYSTVTIAPPTEKSIGDFAISRTDLINASKFVSQSNNNGTRNILQGINLSNTGISATDSYKAYFKGLQNEESNVTISKEFVSMLLKISDEEEIQIYFSDTRCFAKISDNIKVYGMLLNDPYPKINKLSAINENHTEINIDKAKIKEAINLLRFDESTAFDLVSQNDVLYIQTETLSIEVGNASVAVNCCLSKESLFAFNLLDNAKVYYASPLIPLHLKTETVSIIIVPMRKG